MHIVALLIESNTAIAATQMNKLICCRALANREKNAFCVTRPMINRVVWVPRNDLVETSSSSCLVIRSRAFGVAAIVLVVCENEIQASCFFLYWSVHQELWQRCTSLSVAFHFLLVKCVLKYDVDHTWQRTSASLIYERFHGH